MIALCIPLMRWILKKTLNKIGNKNNNKYYAKLKGNQKKLLAKAIDISNTKETTDTFISELKQDGKNLVQRTVSTFTNDSCFYHQKMTHIKTIIKIDKFIHKTNKKTGEITKTTTTSFAIANFLDTAQLFHDIQLKHSRDTCGKHEILKKIIVIEEIWPDIMTVYCYKDSDVRYVSYNYYLFSWKPFMLISLFYFVKQTSGYQ